MRALPLVAHIGWSDLTAHREPLSSPLLPSPLPPSLLPRSLLPPPLRPPSLRPPSPRPPLPCCPVVPSDPFDWAVVRVLANCMNELLTRAVHVSLSAAEDRADADADGHVNRTEVLALLRMIDQYQEYSMHALGACLAYCSTLRRCNVQV